MEKYLGRRRLFAFARARAALGLGVDYSTVCTAVQYGRYLGSRDVGIPTVKTSGVDWREGGSVRLFAGGASIRKICAASACALWCVVTGEVWKTETRVAREAENGARLCAQGEQHEQQQQGVRVRRAL